MTMFKLGGCLGGAALLISAAVGCGGTVDLKTDQLDSAGTTGTSGAATTDGGSSNGGNGSEAEPMAGAPSTAEPLSGCSGDAQQVGWQWNTACASTVDEYCARDGAVCASDWATAQEVESWCSSSKVNAVTFIPSCKGYDVVSVHGSDATGDDPSLFNTYYYDESNGELVHVDTNRIPSCTQCQAGTSGSKFDVFGCDYALVECR